MPEVDHTNLCSVKLVMLNVIITHVERNYRPAFDADTMCHDSIACGRFIFLVLTEGTDQLELKSFTILQPENILTKTVCACVCVQLG